MTWHLNGCTPLRRRSRIFLWRTTKSWKEMKKMKPRAMRTLPWNWLRTRLPRLRNLRNPSSSKSPGSTYYRNHLAVTFDYITGPAFWYLIRWLDAAVTESWQRCATICKSSIRLRKERNHQILTSLACSPKRQCPDLASKYLNKIIIQTAEFMFCSTPNLLWR